MDSLFHRTMSQLERSLTCELIASDLNGVISFSTSDAEILAIAMQNKFSRVALRDEHSAQHTDVTHVAIVDLQKSCIVERREIRVDDLIAAETPLSKAIEILQKRGFCFVLLQDDIRRILTRSDLNKLPMRVYLSTLLAHLEGLLAEVIHNTFQDDWIMSLSQERQDAVKQLFEKKKQNDFDTRLVDCTTLSDKSTIISKSKEIHDAVLGLSRKKCDKHFKTITSLRNRLDHGLSPLTENDDELRDHLYHNQQLTKEKDVEWLAGVVTTIRAWIECLTMPEEVTDYGA